MITNQKLKKSLEEIKNITSFDAILYSAKGKHLTGTVEEPEHSDIFVKEFIVSEEDVREKNDAIAFAVEIDSELEYVLVMFCQYTSENLVIGRMAVCQLRTLVGKHHVKTDGYIDMDWERKSEKDAFAAIGDPYKTMYEEGISIFKI